MAGWLTLPGCPSRFRSSFGCRPPQCRPPKCRLGRVGICATAKVFRSCLRPFPYFTSPRLMPYSRIRKNIITLSPNIHATTLKSTACIGMLTPSRNKHVRHTHNRTPHNTRHTLASPVVSDIRTCSFIATCNHNLLSDPSSPNLTRLIKCKIIYVTVTSCWLCSCLMVRARSQQSANIDKPA